MPGELGRIPQLVLRDAGLVAVESHLVVQLLPRDRMEFVAQAQEAAERGHGISDMAADLLDHETLDGPDMLPAHVVDGGAFDMIALDERMAWSR